MSSIPHQKFSHVLDVEANYAQIAALAEEFEHVTLADGSNRAIGVIISPGICKPGEVIAVAKGGIGEVIAGGPIARGDWIGSDANGKAVKVTSGAAIGYALQSAVADDMFRVRLQPAIVPSPAVEP